MKAIHPFSLAVVLSFTTTALTYYSLPVQAKPILYQEVGGRESLNFDPAGLAILESICLSLTFADSTDIPAPVYTNTFKILPPSSTARKRGTTQMFTYDAETGDYIFLPLL